MHNSPTGRTYPEGISGGKIGGGADNGPLSQGKGSICEGGIRVPTFVYWKNKVKSGSVTDKFGMLMDLFPTFCEVAKVDAPKGLDAISILPTILGKEQANFSYSN